MGYYKSLLTQALEGDREIIKTIAKDFEAKKQYKYSLRWYNEINDSASANRITKLMEQYEKEGEEGSQGSQGS
jgi:hypothetical protein